jgi:phosphatidylserine/phosphatidylglycerophosphate/cardiolipin synthase-like enzyme
MMKFVFAATLIALPTLGLQAQVKAYFNQNQSAQYIEPYRNITRPGDDLEKVVVDQILAAKKSVYVAVQELRLPRVAQALIAQKNAGLNVFVILEHDYNFTVVDQQDTTNPESEYDASKLNELKAFVDTDKNGRLDASELMARDAVYMLRQAGVPIIDDTFDKSMGAGLMHHKFVVIDGKTTVVSSANLTMSCIHGDTLAATSRGNANSMIVAQSVDMARIFTEEFIQMWGNGKRGNFGQNKTYRGQQKVSIRGTNITIQFSPTSRKYTWMETTNGLIASTLAKSTTSIKAALFVFSDQMIANSMEERHEHGVDVGVVVEQKFVYRDYSEVLDLLGLKMLNSKCAYEPDNNPWRHPITEAGVARLPTGDVLHHKFAVVDNKTVVMGSQNWSDSANFTNDETLLVVENSAISEQYAQEYNRLRSTSTMGITNSLKAEIHKKEATCASLGVSF